VDEREERVAAVKSRLVALAKGAVAMGSPIILVSNLTEGVHLALDPFDASDPRGLQTTVSRANGELARELSTLPNTYVFDYSGLVGYHGEHSWADSRLWYMGRLAVSRPNLRNLAKHLARTYRGIVRASAKCIVVDLDNTLWGGVLGDDGLEGIQLGQDYPGRAFLDLQTALLAKQRTGCLLAIASKNDESMVLEALDKHPEMILRSEHFAAIHASWNPKALSIERIAKALNIGLESIVFLDDNPLERAEVRLRLPLVHVVDLPADVTGYVEALQSVEVLDRAKVLEEDRMRTEMYRADNLRNQLLSGVGSVNDYLHELEMRVSVGLIGPETGDRIHQLIQKTNQFNLTTRRYGPQELAGFGKSANHRVAWLRLRDKFGDLGLVCVGIVERLDDARWRVDVLLMSCRVMGRGVEEAFLGYLEELVRTAGGTILCGEYITTPRNGIVSGFYESCGYRKLGMRGEVSEYMIDLTQKVRPWPAHLHRESGGMVRHDG
jgi:FkbH-like protein